MVQSPSVPQTGIPDPRCDHAYLLARYLLARHALGITFLQLASMLMPMVPLSSSRSSRARTSRRLSPPDARSSRASGEALRLPLEALPPPLEVMLEARPRRPPLRRKRMRTWASHCSIRRRQACRCSSISIRVSHTRYGFLLALLSSDKSLLRRC